MAKKVARRVKVGRIASASAKTKVAMKEPRMRAAAQCVPMGKLQSTMAKYRMAMAKLNSERHHATVLSCRIHDLQCKIIELEQKLAAGQASTST